MFGGEAVVCGEVFCLEEGKKSGDGNSVQMKRLLLQFLLFNIITVRANPFERRQRHSLAFLDDREEDKEKRGRLWSLLQRELPPTSTPISLG